MGQMGRLAGGLLGGALSEGVKHWSRGQKPAAAELFLTPANAERLAQRLSKMRGAAMKLGQLLSMDGGETLPPELSQLLERLREQAHHMPIGQLNQVLKAEWGDAWDEHFESFQFTPVAAASIGQVHRAQLKDGRELAFKVQYPGVRQSIDSDLDNLAMLLRSLRLLPAHLQVDSLIVEARQQLHDEANYALEAEYLQAFAERLNDDERYQCPQWHSDWSTEQVLAMDWLDGIAVEQLSAYPLAERNRVAAELLRLTLRELLQWGLVQTDPNFANYRYQCGSGRIQLLDFGATRRYDDAFTNALQKLIRASLDSDEAMIYEAASALGYFDGKEPAEYRQLMLSLFQMAVSPARHSGAFDFSNSSLAQQMRQRLIEVRLKQQAGQIPPARVLLLHRKLAGMYLLYKKLQVKLDVGAIVREFI